MATVPTITGTIGRRVPAASSARKISQTPKIAKVAVTRTKPSGRNSRPPRTHTSMPTPTTVAAGRFRPALGVGFSRCFPRLRARGPEASCA